MPEASPSALSLSERLAAPSHTEAARAGVNKRVLMTRGKVRNMLVVVLAFAGGFVVRPYAEEAWKHGRAEMHVKEQAIPHRAEPKIDTKSESEKALDNAIDNLIANYDGKLINKTIVHCVCHGQCSRNMSDFFDKHPDVRKPVQDVAQLLALHPELADRARRRIIEKLNASPNDPRKELIVPRLESMGEDELRQVSNIAANLIDTDRELGRLDPEIAGRVHPAVPLHAKPAAAIRGSMPSTIVAEEGKSAVVDR